MLRKLQVGLIVGIATALWSLVLLYRGEPVTWRVLGSFSAVVSTTFAIVWLFDRYVWPCRVKGWCVFHGWLVAAPDIRGTWEVALQSSWLDPSTGQSASPIRCYYGVRQTSSGLRMHLMTPESDSWLLAHRFVPSSKTHGYQLIAAYSNEPHALLRGTRSEIHRGAFVLDFYGADPACPDAFTGEYWTDRGTKGTLAAKRIGRRVVSTHADGVAFASATVTSPCTAPARPAGSTSS